MTTTATRTDHQRGRDFAASIDNPQTRARMYWDRYRHLENAGDLFAAGFCAHFRNN